MPPKFEAGVAGTLGVAGLSVSTWLLALDAARSGTNPDQPYAPTPWPLTSAALIAAHCYSPQRCSVIYDRYNPIEALAEQSQRQGMPDAHDSELGVTKKGILTTELLMHRWTHIGRP